MCVCVCVCVCGLCNPLPLLACRQPVHMRWAFTLKRGDALRKKWQQIPEGIDFLVTHGPPLGYRDNLANGGKAGCLDLLYEIKHRVKPKYHIFGHIHEGNQS